jgi:hypothetical protein
MKVRLGMDEDEAKTTLQSIDRNYKPGMLAWLKVKRPGDWQKMIAIEAEINRAAIQGNEAELIIALDEYEGFVLGMVKMFGTRTEETGNLFLNLQG